MEQSLSILDSSVNKLQMTGSGEGQIDIAVLRTLSTHLVPGLVRDYIKEHPKQNIDFRFHNSTGLTPDMIEGLKSRKYDIAFCSKMENEPAIEFIPVSKQELVLIVPNGHPLCTRDEIDLADTLPYPHIGFSRRSGLRPIIDKLFKECKGQPQYTYEVEEDQAVAGLVSAGFGIAVVPHMALLAYMPVQIIRIVNPTWERMFYMCTLKDVYQAPAINDFKEFVKRHATV